MDSREDLVTVGLDGSAESLSAARWAAAEAHRLGCALHLLHAWVLLASAPQGIPAERDQNFWAEHIVHDAAKELHRLHPDLRITEGLVAEEASAALLEAAEQSRMLVLGSRGLGTMESFFLGDTSLHVTVHADQPVVLVRAVPEVEESPPSAETIGVVLGLSLHGSGDSLLRFSFDAAAGRRMPLYVVHGKTLPLTAHTPWGVKPDTAEEHRREAETRLTEALRPWRERYPQVRVVDSVRLESPAHAVMRAARDADLLVVGRRRHHRPLTPHLGAVAQAAVHHAGCPVAVVPHD
ncbi:stress-inducible protein [Streptomyces albus subsp. albus]|nr:stress-inducible protein [Streptomyces albus subsp. albus]